LTYPFVLSWSLLDSMAIECPIIASKTAPVLEVMEDNYNGLLFDFYDIDQQVEKIEYALDNKDKMVEIRQNARKTILDKYDLKDLLPKHVEYVKSLAK
jgi:glycosyltransferase involved in cell wall biosynthesis